MDDAVLRWRADRYRLEGPLFDPLTCELVPARVAVSRLLAELQDDLRVRGEWPAVVELVERLCEAGTPASRQRRTAPHR